MGEAANMALVSIEGKLMIPPEQSFQGFHSSIIVRSVVEGEVTKLGNNQTQNLFMNST